MDSKRLKRTTNAQYEELICFVEQHIILLQCKTKPQEVGVIKNLWQQFADEINASGLGPCKTAQQWKKILFEWKCNVKRKSRQVKIERLRTGGGTYKAKQLTDPEQRLLSLLSSIHLGCEQLPDELGVENEQSNIEMCDVIEPMQYSVGDIIEIDPVIHLQPASESQPSESTERLVVIENATPEVARKSPTEPQILMKKKVVLRGNINRKGKNKSEHDDRYTGKFPQSAAKSYNDAQESRYEAAVRNADSITALGSAIESFAAVYKEGLIIEREKIEIAKISAEAAKVKAEALLMQARMEFLKLQMAIMD